MNSSRWIAAIIIAAALAIFFGARMGGWGEKRPVNILPPAQVGTVPAPPAVAPTPPQPSASAPAVPPAPAPAPPLAPSAPPLVRPSSVPATPPPADSPPGTSDADRTAKEPQEIDKISLMFRDYRTLMATNPVGSNAEIMASIIGGNPKKARLGPPEGLRLNEKGELIDAWGTPYFFHQMSAMNMEITSAGPDRKFGTSDDIKGR